jgi:restriction system protein
VAGSSTIPRVEQLLWPTLQALKSSGGSASGQELLAKLVSIMGLPPSVQTVSHGTGRVTEVTFRAFQAWTYLRLFGALELSAQGVWSVTKSGREMDERQVANIPTRARNLVRQLSVVDEAESEDRWKEELIGVLQSMPPDAFERLAQRILRESGFVEVEVTGRTGDGGIDGLGSLRVNLLSFQVFFQCKRYKGTVGAGVVRDFRGAMVGRGERGLLITTGRFSIDAEREANRSPTPVIDLVDGDQLCDLLKSLRIGVVTDTVQRVTLRPNVFAEM